MNYSTSLFNFLQRVESFKLKYPLEFDELVHEYNLRFSVIHNIFTIHSGSILIFRHICVCGVSDTLEIHDRDRYYKYLIDSVSKLFFNTDNSDSILYSKIHISPLRNSLFKKMLGIKSNITETNRYIEFYLTEPGHE